MDIAIVFEWFAPESVFAAELTHEQPQREMWIRLAEMWASAAAGAATRKQGRSARMLLSTSVAAPRAAQG